MIWKDTNDLNRQKNEGEMRREVIHVEKIGKSRIGAINNFRTTMIGRREGQRMVIDLFVSLVKFAAASCDEWPDNRMCLGRSDPLWI